MKILRKNDGALTNFEVLEFLRSRGATSDPLGCIGAVVSASECKVYDYLIQSPAGTQTRKDIDEFLKGCENFDLAKAEKLNIINERPSYPAEMYTIIECYERRFKDETIGDLVKLVEVLPPPPKSEEETSNQEEADAEAEEDAEAE